MIESGNLKRGDCIVYKGAPVTVTDVTTSTPSARGAGIMIKTKMRNLLTGAGLTETLRAGERFDEPDLEQHPCSYMYSDGTKWHFMDEVTYEQFEQSADELGEAVGYLKDGLEGLRAMVLDGSVVSITLPTTVDLEITETDPAIKGATAKAQLKSATLETGKVIQVPPYLSMGEKVRVDTRDGRFVERAKD